MALDIWINSSLAKLNSMLTPKSVLPNRSLNELLQLAWANRDPWPKPPLVAAWFGWYTSPWVAPQQAAIVNAVPQQAVLAPTIQQPQYIANAFTPQWLTWQFLNTSNATADLFNDYERAINPYLQDYNKNSFALWNDILGQLNQQKTNYLNQFWPQWTIQQQLDSYYNWLWQYNASQQAAQQALQSNEALRATWSSAAANLAWQKVSDDFANKVNEAAKQRLDEQSKIYQQLNNYLNQFTTQYANTKDKYVLWTYKNLFDLKNQLAWQILQQQNALLSAQLTKNTTPTATAWTPTAAKTATVGGKTVNLNNVTSAIKAWAKPLSAAAAELSRQWGITKKVNISSDKSKSVTPSSWVIWILKNLWYIK
jgi:hypothetical protein